MTHQSLIERITRSLAYMLRHKPEEFDLELDEYGAAAIEEIVQVLNERLGEPIEEDDVLEAIESGDRPRYAAEDGRIRALYGHSIEVDPGDSSKPQELLYVGLSARDAEKATQYGLRAGRRTFLHLAKDFEQALETGRRQARSYAVVTVYSLDAWEQGVNFYDRDSLYLSDPIPTEFLELGEVHEDGEPPQRDGRGGGDRDRDRGRRRGGSDDRGRGRDRRDDGRRSGRGRGRDDDRSRDDDRPRDDDRARDEERPRRDEGESRRRDGDRDRGRGRGRGDRDRGGDRERGGERGGDRERGRDRDRDRDRERAPRREAPARAERAERDERPAPEPSRAERAKPAPERRSGGPAFGVGVVEDKPQPKSAPAPAPTPPPAAEAPAPKPAPEPKPEPKSSPGSFGAGI